MGQQFRLSQFIFNYGPGAIMETINGPRIIPAFDTGLFKSRQIIGGKELAPEEYEINYQPLSNGLLGGVRIFRMPSNAELNINENVYIYDTFPFPEWALCLENNVNILYNISEGCPYTSRCPKSDCNGRNYRDAIRFVRACPEGHLDDVDWNYAVHKGASCKSKWFYWKRNGPGLKDISIICPRCHKTENLGYIYQMNMPCRGRLPEKRGAGAYEKCESSARVIQRQASNLRVPEIISLFTVPPRHTNLHRLLENGIISSNIYTNKPKDKEALEETLNKLVEIKAIPAVSRDKILQYDWEDIQRAIEDINKPVLSNYRDILIEEFHRLIDASIYGVSATKPGEPEYLFEVIKSKIKKVNTSGGRTLRVAPVSRLNAVIVQRGYRRFIGSNLDDIRLVDISYTDPNQNRWLPGIEILGEGIFIMLDDDDGWHFKMSGDSYTNWYNVYLHNSDEYSPNLFRYPGEKDELHPVFVWWHTLSHIMNRTISVDSGYSTASIRERIYFEISDDGRARGGILLYAVQPGADGTLGGLISLVPHFDDILSSVMKNIDSCSNDPICEEINFSAGRCTGSACYSCTLISETSCEHRNLWLDRKILMENMP